MTIDREGLSNGRAASILSLYTASPRHVPSLGQGQDPLCSCTFILQNGIKLCANESRPRIRAVRLEPVCALGSSSYIRPKRMPKQCATELLVRTSVLSVVFGSRSSLLGQSAAEKTRGSLKRMVRAAQASPDHGFCGVRARAGAPSCLELR